MDRIFTLSVCFFLAGACQAAAVSGSPPQQQHVKGVQQVVNTVLPMTAVVAASCLEGVSAVDGVTFGESWENTSWKDEYFLPPLIIGIAFMAGGFAVGWALCRRCCLGGAICGHDFSMMRPEVRKSRMIAAAGVNFELDSVSGAGEELEL